MTIFNDKTAQDILDQTVAEGPLTPLELETRSGVMFYNHLRVLQANMLKEFLDNTVLHEETRQVAAETILRLNEFTEFLKERPRVSFRMDMKEGN